MRISDWSSDVCSSDLADRDGKAGDEQDAAHALSRRRHGDFDFFRHGSSTVGGTVTAGKIQLHATEQCIELIALGFRQAAQCVLARLRSDLPDFRKNRNGLLGQEQADSAAIILVNFTFDAAGDPEAIYKLRERTKNGP